MSDIVGSIRPAVQLTEIESFDAPTGCINVRDASGRLHGQIRWLADEMDDDAFDDAVNALCAAVFKLRRRRPSAAS